MHETTTPTLAQSRTDVGHFLLRRLHEARQIAEGASPGPWHPDEELDEVLAVDGITVAEGFALSGRQLRATTQHIAQHHPVRVLADIKAKEQIVKAYCETVVNPARRHDPALHLQAHVLQQVVRLLATAYDDHADYRDAWRP